MMRVELMPHPETPCPALDSLHVEAARLADGGLCLTYRLAGDIDALVIPTTGLGARRDGLWRHTCCEAFVMADAGPGYREFNFAPSGDWQAYDFSAYRQGGRLEPATAARIEVERVPSQVVLRATLAPESLPSGETLRLGLTAVIESRDGRLAYWALRHVPGKPDFHHTGTFTLDLT
jgi:hypothetical protein